MLHFDHPPLVLAIGAHPDDIELGAGGLIYRLIKDLNATVHFLIITPGIQNPREGFAYMPVSRKKEAQTAARLLGLGEADVEVLDFEDCRLHEVQHKLLKAMERKLREGERPYDLILSHAGGDTHADHRAVHEATLSAARAFKGSLLLYQAPSTRPDCFRGTFFVSLDEKALTQKDLAIQAHASQRDRAEFLKLVVTEGMAKSWAFFLRLPHEHFEAFEVHKSFWLPVTPRHPDVASRDAGATKPNP